MNELSHVDAEGRAHMVDVSAKAETTRVAVATGELRTTAEVVALVRADDMPKADVLSTARIAGIAGAKKTSELIPLCHQLALSSVRVAFGFTEDSITIEATAKTKGPTGVEMEALTAVAVAGLTLHDMVKAVDPAAVLTGVGLLTKDGGKHGHWQRPAAAGPAAPAVTADPRPAGRPAEAESPARPDKTAVVLVASTGAAVGTRTDTTGPALTEWLRGLGFSVRGPLIYADADIAAGLTDALREAPDLVVTTGGTGASPTDATPEATLAVLDRELPGVAEAIRQRGTAKFPLAALSRGVAGLAGRTVIVNLPGSPGGVKDGIAVLEPLLGHLLAQVAGGGDHDNG
ncbi:bifunctional molybdenum cofactor biosynthesis protein MoaC/MoaB [Nocardia cyriacigeorgica]|nr:bifunctional molybdenum cofactor biosynthesis protein MoaC/MoaB [Nocardia cyriacigeorgica]MBF6101809.1 bifunctional molybdenum cofactor biosynthesis protein MoaC/MoaB [Nocardia cyriacigeorgica]MBF6158895.1 bifunctional molybdenum cofactor biosynthesis protein MoaC/MoaB [Nocardia cyriacigeorgica]MBF6197419.1 bifunctional molybdenum cofactor biosynthesis protein MoaC/MoaB [Nocardia cyriacigeorgica]MBF6345181.1 bifunctional molybdenum cofactor biosynthesis protein MoaC/MoaB [Nocardia cyriacigeo